MFTVSDLINIAVQIERNGEATYRRASEQVKDPELVRMLIWMADEEREHRQWFENLSAGKQVSCELVELQTLGQALLQDIMDKQTFSLDETQLSATDDMADLFTQFLEFENDTILFYEILRGFLDDAQVVQHLDLIIAEEREHIEKLEDTFAEKNDGAETAPSA